MEKEEKALTNWERETIARFSEASEDVLVLETFNKKHALRLIASGATVRRTATRGKCVYWTLEMPKGWFKWPRAPRRLTTEEREVASTRMRSLPKRTSNKSTSTEALLVGGGKCPPDEAPSGNDTPIPDPEGRTR